ncbi:MAG: peptidoglycan-binding protein [Hyphomicrobiaceae bacterium]
MTAKTTLSLAAACAVLLGTPVLAQAPESGTPLTELDMAAIPTLGADAIRTVQRKLQQKAIDPGPIDGIVGERTIAAIKTFQERYGMKPTGTADNQLLFALGSPELAAGR